MLAVVPEKRRDGRSSFTQLVTYTICREDVRLDETLSPDKPTVRRSRSKEAIFNNLVDYATRSALPDAENIIATFPDGRQQARFDNVVCETNCFSLATAATEMNAVAVQNSRCSDPVYHAILSWPEEERPDHHQIFDAARYCLKHLGMEGHQYVFAIHDDTDNLHVHLSVNRIHPVSYKAAGLYNDYLNLDRSCRELELKHQWKHDNGPWKVNDMGVIVRNRQFYKPAPAAAKRLEHFADYDSLYSYAVDKCRETLESALMSGQNLSWYDIHDMFRTVGLEIRRKGEGLAVYDLNDDEQTPVRASRIHPELTLDSLREYCGEFYPPLSEETNPSPLVTAHVNIESLYDSLLHKRDRGARAERRIARAEAREDLKARYRAYKTGFVRPVIAKEDVRNRHKALSMAFRVRKNNVRLTQRDPLLRKLMYRALEVEKMKAVAALRLQVREERNALKLLPSSRCLTYRAWVEVQAAVHFDAAAVSQLRGWAYREKKGNRTKPISSNMFLHSVADDISPPGMRGYERRVNRDGAVVYMSGEKPVLIDRGPYVEVASAPEEKYKHIALAMHISGLKSGERVEVIGERQYRKDTLDYVRHTSVKNGKPVPLTHPQQRMEAGCHQPSANRPERENHVDVPLSKVQNHPFPKPG